MKAAVLIAIILGIVVIGGGTYFVMQQQTPAQTTTGAGNLDALPATDNNSMQVQADKNKASVSQQTGSGAEDSFTSGFKTGQTNFLAKIDTIAGVLTVVFGTQITRADGGDYEAFILFGDGEEESVAHWSPTLFNEEMNHEYRQPGEYTASLVLVPKTLLTEDVLQRRKKIVDLNGTTLIKTIRVSVDVTGKITIRN